MALRGDVWIPVHFYCAVVIRENTRAKICAATNRLLIDVGLPGFTIAHKYLSNALFKVKNGHHDLYLGFFSKTDCRLRIERIYIQKGKMNMFAGQGRNELEFY